jgi:hypothetical protein
VTCALPGVWTTVESAAAIGASPIAAAVAAMASGAISRIFFISFSLAHAVMTRRDHRRNSKLNVQFLALTTPS